MEELIEESNGILINISEYDNETELIQENNGVLLISNDSGTNWGQFT